MQSYCSVLQGCSYIDLMNFWDDNRMNTPTSLQNVHSHILNHLTSALEASSSDTPCTAPTIIQFSCCKALCQCLCLQAIADS